MGATMPPNPMAYFSQSYTVPSRTGLSVPTDNINKGPTNTTSAGRIKGGVPSGNPDLTASPKAAVPNSKGPAIRP